MTARQRIQERVNALRWRDYSRSSTAIYLRWQPFRAPPGCNGRQALVD